MTVAGIEDSSSWSEQNAIKLFISTSSSSDEKFDGEEVDKLVDRSWKLSFEHSIEFLTFSK